MKFVPSPLNKTGVPLPFAREVKRDFKAELVQQLNLVGILIETEFRFHPVRKWRTDWHVVDTKILIEFEGGLFAKGKQGHSSINGIHRDIEKYNNAALLGYTVIRVTPKHVESGQALQWIEQAVSSAHSLTLTGVNDKHSGRKK